MGVQACTDNGRGAVVGRLLMGCNSSLKKAQTNHPNQIGPVGPVNLCCCCLFHCRCERKVFSQANELRWKARLPAPCQGVITFHLVMLSLLSPSRANRLNDEDRMDFLGSSRVFCLLFVRRFYLRYRVTGLLELLHK